MIRYDGYYIEKPTKVINGRVKDYPVSFSATAFMFNQDNSLKIRSKHNNKELLSDFIKKDFTGSEVGLDKEFIIEGNHINIPKQKSYEGDIILDIINSEELFNRISQKPLKFISWKDVEEAKTPILLSIFGSLKEDNFQTRYE